MLKFLHLTLLQMLFLPSRYKTIIMKFYFESVYKYFYGRDAKYSSQRCEIRNFLIQLDENGHSTLYNIIPLRHQNFPIVNGFSTLYKFNDAIKKEKYFLISPNVE